MFTHLSLPLAAFLVIFTAAGYAVATIGMKLASGGPTVVALIFIIVGLAGAVIAEVVLLRHASLTVIYIGIVVFESLLVLAYAAYASGALNLPQMVGALMVLGGFAIVTVADKHP